MRVRWNKRALLQLRAAHDYIKGENPHAASEFVGAANSLADLFGEYPGMGVRTDEPSVIMFPLVRYRYLIFYKIVNGEEIRIIRLRHASRKRRK
jgi:plasmid stabilization system protein ParE